MIVPVRRDLDCLLALVVVFSRDSLLRSGGTTRPSGRTRGDGWLAIVRRTDFDAVRPRTQAFFLRNVVLTVRDVGARGRHLLAAHGSEPDLSFVQRRSIESDFSIDCAPV